LLKPPGSLGALEELAVWLAAWQGRTMPRLERARLVVFAGNHGVTAQGISAYPPAVTGLVVAALGGGGAAAAQLARAAGAELAVLALALERPTADLSLRPAMSEAECLEAFAQGQAAVEPGLDLLALGEVGIGNTTAAAAISLALFGGAGGDWAGAGTGLSAEGVRRKASLIERAVARHRLDPADGLQVLRHLGGRELAATAGAIVAARLARVPVLLDGFAIGAAAATLAVPAPAALAHCRAAHVSAEPGHRRLLARLGLAPLLDLNLRLGEGTGALLAVPLARAAAFAHAGMQTFADAGLARPGGGHDQMS